MTECLDTGKKSAEEIQHFKPQLKGKIKQTKEGKRKKKKITAENVTANAEVKILSSPSQKTSYSIILELHVE